MSAQAPNFYPAIDAATQPISPDTAAREFVDAGHYGDFVITTAWDGGQRGDMRRKHGRYFQHLGMLRDSGLAIPQVWLTEDVTEAVNPDGETGDFIGTPYDSFLVVRKITPVPVEEIDQDEYLRAAENVTSSLASYVDLSIGEDVPWQFKHIHHTSFEGAQRYTFGTVFGIPEPKFYLNNVRNVLRPLHDEEVPSYKQQAYRIGSELIAGLTPQQPDLGIS